MTAQPQQSRRQWEELTPKQQDAIRRLRNLATYIVSSADEEFEMFEPAPRGRKGRDHSQLRTISFVVGRVMRFDDIGWRQWHDEWRTPRPK